MRSLARILLTGLLAAFISGTAAAATTTLNVHVQDPDGGNLPGVKVAAIQYGMNGPSTHTQVGLTNGSGNAAFTIEQQLGYSVYVSSHGYSPTIAEQFNDPEYNPSRHIWPWDATPVYSTFTLTPGLTGVGRISQAFTSATIDKVLMGGLYNMKAQMPGPSGMVITDNSGAGTLEIENVPYALANTYNIGLYDPTLNRGIGRNVMTDLGDGVESPGSPSISYPALDFNNSIPPTRAENNGGSGGGTSASGASVEGVVYEVGYPTATVSHTGIGIKACAQGMDWNGWAHTDDNGRFQLFGLKTGTTYYFSVMGGCTWTPSGPGACYGPYSAPQYSAQDICLADHSAKDANDLLYVSSDVAYHSVKLARMERSNGQIRVYVRSTSGFNIPNANVQVNPDGTPWPVGPDSCGNPAHFQVYPSTHFVNNQGFSNAMANTSATGYALLEGLPSGNYMLNVWTPFSNSNSNNGPTGFNAGPNGTFANWGDQNQGGNFDWRMSHCVVSGADDYRVTIDTNPATNGGQTMHVYNSSGTDLALSSITYLVTAGGGASNTGEVRGTLKFPGPVDLSENPIMITLYGQCRENEPCPPGNFTAVPDIGASVSDHYDYVINVSSGFSYWMKITSVGWGRVRRGGGDDSIHLTGSTSAVVSMEFARAGTVSGTMYKPDGTIYTPANNQWIWVDAGTDSGWTGTQLQKDGTFSMPDVLPGINRISVNASGNNTGENAFRYSLPSPAPTVTVVAGSTATLNINLVNANYVGVKVSTGLLPDPTVVMSSNDSVLGFRVVPLPAGTMLKGEVIMEMLFGKEGDQGRIRYSEATTSQQNGPCGQNWPGGFCGASLPSPAVYDFYLMRAGDFGDMSADIPNRPYPHFTLLTSSKNVIVDNDHAVDAVKLPSYSMGQSSGVLVDMDPPATMAGRGNATLFGSVKAANFFRQADYDACGGDFEEFLKYLPVATLYDDKGLFKAAGIVVPPLPFIRAHDQDFDIKFAEGYPAFKTLLDGATSYNFEIRGLKPLDCFTAVVTTPNYPPYQTRKCVGANGTLTAITVDLDAAVGKGATVQGIVTSTNSAVRLSNVTVELTGEAAGSRSIVTDSTGAYKFEGLPEGGVRLKVTAEGYALADAEEELVGNNTYVINFTSDTALVAAGGSIAGTVYAQKLPFAKVQAGAQIVAYNDSYNGTHPDEPLPLIKTKTGSDGTYKLTGLIPGDIYKIFLKVPGRYTLTIATPAVSGALSGMDFTMLPKPLDIEMFAKKTDTDFEITVLNPKDFKNGWAGWNTHPFSGVNASTISMTELASGELFGKIPLSALTAGQVYALRGVARSYSGKQVVKELLFGKDYKGNATQQIDDAILGDDSEDETGRKGNEVPMDKSGDDPSGIVFPPGAVLPVSTGAIPTCSFKGEDKDSSAVADKVAALGAAAFAGDLYTVALTSITSNENKAIELTLAYDKSTADLTDLSVSRYNEGTGKWEQVPGVATINPLKGTVKVKLKTLASVLAVRPGSVQVNSFDGRQYVVRPQAAGGSSPSGTFAVTKPSVAGDNLAAGAPLKVFNYPNPFSLKAKTVAAHNHDAGNLPSLTTYGTFIHVEVPAANGGACHIRIYTLAGELVKDLSSTCVGGKYNYFEWNGRNQGGREVADGVYYGVVELSGGKPDRKDATFKMVVVK